MTAFWVTVTVLGFVFLAFGLAGLFRRYRNGDIDGVQFTAFLVACVSFSVFAVAAAVRPELASGRAALGILSPAFIAIVILVRKHRSGH